MKYLMHHQRASPSFRLRTIQGTVFRERSAIHNKATHMIDGWGLKPTLDAFQPGARVHCQCWVARGKYEGVQYHTTRRGGGKRNGGQQHRAVAQQRLA